MTTHPSSESEATTVLSSNPSFTAESRSGPAEETLISPRRNTFFPWSAGPQNCPGEKFSHVEVVAVLAALFHRHRVHIVADAGETDEAAIRRVVGVVEDCDMQMLLRMKNPEKVRVRWEGR